MASSLVAGWLVVLSASAPKMPSTLGTFSVHFRYSCTEKLKRKGKRGKWWKAKTWEVRNRRPGEKLSSSAFYCVVYTAQPLNFYRVGVFKFGWNRQKMSGTKCKQFVGKANGKWAREKPPRRKCDKKVRSAIKSSSKSKPAGQSSEAS